MSTWGGLRRKCAPAAKTALFKAGAHSVLRTVYPSRGLAILRYHAICGPEGYAYAEPGICISPAAFEKHVAYLTSAYRVLSLPDAVSAIRSGKSLPSNAVVITFDDGYADNLPAARVLQRYGATATFYITAGCMSGESPFWPAEIRELVQRVKGTSIRLEAGSEPVILACSNERERQDAVRALAKLYKRHPIPVREALRDQLRALAGGEAVASPMLSWAELAEMAALGMTIGAHTVTHPNLPSAGAEDSWKEIAGSKARLEKELGTAVTMFSYPNGGAERYVTPAIAQMVREAGFDAATTSRNGFASRQSDLYALERVQVAERLEDLVFALEAERFAFKPQDRSSNARAAE